MASLSKRKIAIIAIFFVFIGIGIYYIAGVDNSPSADVTVAERRDIIQEVSVTGRVKPAESVDLAFEESGEVISAPVSVGDFVSKGKILAQLKNGENNAELARAEANVKLEEAKLEELVKGYTAEEIEVQKIKAANAESSLTEAKRNMIVKISDAFTKTDDAVRNNADQFINNPGGSNPQLTFFVNDSNLKFSIESKRVSIESILKLWSKSLSALTLESEMTAEIEEAKTNLGKTKDFLDDAALAVNSLTASSDYSQATINAYRSDVSSARADVNTAISNLSSAIEKLQMAQSALLLERQELALKTSGTRSEQIDAQEAKVEEAKAAVLSRKAEIDKTFLVAPIQGIVTLQEAKVGEIVSAREVIVSIISQAKFEIEAKVPEADIANIRIGDTAKVTLDAYGSGTLFNAGVISIDPAEKIIEGVATYRTILRFDEKDERVRSGMTANIDIKTGEKTNAIAIPARAVITKDGRKIVRVLGAENTVIEAPVTTGLRSPDGFIEIMQGVNAGDKIILFLPQ
jgi:HlyD family secretion protein